MAVYKVSNSGYLPFIEKGQFEPEFTEIENRAPVDSSLKTVFGNERVHVNSLRKLTKEFGPNGEPVFEPDNGDSRIRFVGNWKTSFSENGMFVVTNSAFINPDEYIEITFYGTGLNLLHSASNIATDDINIDVVVDGASQGVTDVGNTSPVITDRNYKDNTKSNLVSKETLGWHTVKLRGGVGSQDFLRVYGFEILNESTNMTVVSGVAHGNGYKYPIENDQTLSYNTGFENIADGNLGSRGGRAIVYIDPKDGLIKKRFTKVDDTAQYLGSTDHSNEAIYRKINFREFGRNRGDDFSTLSNSNTDRIFTLDDGTTTLVGNSISTNGAGDRLDIDTSASFYTITFVGTGLDVFDPGGGALNIGDVYVDGVNQGIYARPASGQIVKLCSGLSYGTHTVKIDNTIYASSASIFNEFIIYQPKKPDLPEGAVVLADYNLMADFVANNTAGVDTIATGILRKVCSREFTYVSPTTADFELNPDLDVAGQAVVTKGTSNSTSLTFFGTGFDFRAYAGNTWSQNVLVELNGITLNTTNYPGITSFQYGDFTFNDSTGIADVRGSNNPANGFGVSGLPLDHYTLKLTSQDGNNIGTNTLDAITPIHSPHTTFGSLSLKDCRNFDSSKDVNKDIKGGTKVLASFTSNDNTVGQSKNVSQILDGGTGVFDVYFEDVFVDEDYIDVVSNAENQRDTITQLQRINSVRVLGRDGDSATTVDPGRVSLTIDGKLQKDELEE